MTKRTFLRTVAATLAVVCLGNVASAASPEAGWRGRLWMGPVGRYVLTDNEAYSDPPFGTVELKVDGSSFGFGGDVEYKFNRRLGFDFAVAYTKPTIQFTSSVNPAVVQTTGLSTVPLLFALNLHVVSNKKVDIWFGPQVGYVIWGGTMEFAVPPAGVFVYEPKSVFSPLGFDVGTDVFLSDSVALNLAFRWQNADADGDGHLTVDPTFVTAGVTFKF